MWVPSCDSSGLLDSNVVEELRLVIGDVEVEAEDFAVSTPP